MVILTFRQNQGKSQGVSNLYSKHIKMSLFWNDRHWYFKKDAEARARDSSFVLVKKLYVGNIREPVKIKVK